MNIEMLNSAVSEYARKIRETPENYADDWNEREERKKFYQRYTRKKLSAMSEDDFYEYVAKLWSMVIWGNKEYIVEKLKSDNDFENIKECLAILLYGKDPIDERWDHFLKNIKGIGPSTMSGLLSYINPDEYIMFNKTTTLCLTHLGVDGMPKYNYQYTGRKYVEACVIAKSISQVLKENGLEDVDLLAVDYFLWDEIRPLVDKNTTIETIQQDTEKISSNESQSLHDEIRNKIVEIGELLGFESKPEVKIAAGAVVDAIWEAKIGNMGKAIYVFEVQSKGSIDSLILNLKKAQSNAVQAVVAVADEAQIAKIKDESKGVIEEKALRTWDSNDVLSVHDALVRAHESINKLALVPESF